MKRFLTFVIAGAIAWWAWWYTFSVDPGGDGFGWETCSDGEGVCSDDPSVLFLIVAISAGIVAFFALLSTISLIRRKLRGDDATKQAAAAWGGQRPMASWSQPFEQMASSLQQGIAAAQQSTPTWTSTPGAGGVPAAAVPAADPAAVSPAVGAPSASMPASGDPAPADPVRTPTAADRAASRDRWLRRAEGAGPGGPAAAASSTALTGVPAASSALTGIPSSSTRSGAGTSTWGSTGRSASTGSTRAAESAHAASTSAVASVVLVAIGPRELGVQREVRRLSGYDLEGAKRVLAAVAERPQYVAIDLPWDEAQQVRRTFERMGATVELRTTT